ncbi:MAG: RNA polymerase sigma factor SigZ [Gemmataceae bacterium]|nr:RNA polymerase sigma factor SigZ [Gemmataceae bacterium]
MTARPTTESVWTQLSSDLWRFIRRKASDDHAADDLLQETFVRIHGSIAGLKDTDRLAAWVYRIARNVVHDHHRKGSRASVPILDEVAATEDGTRDLRRQTATWLPEMVDRLPDGYREAVRLAEIGGLNQQDVADRLGLSLSGAKSRIQRGRGMLKEVLLGCCDFELDRRGNIVDCVPKPDRTVCLDCDELVEPTNRSVR